MLCNCHTARRGRLVSTLRGRIGAALAVVIVEAFLDEEMMEDMEAMDIVQSSLIPIFFSTTR